MDYCGAGSLLDAMTVTGRCLTELQIAHALKSTLYPLRYIHSKGVMHRDIKAANLLLNEFGVVKLADFGVSAEITALTKRSTVIGSPYWMAPEVSAEDVQYDQAADVWSLGITAIELAEGNPPLYDMHPMRALIQIQRRTPPVLQPDSGNWSDDFHDFVACCLQRQATDRWLTNDLLDHPFVLGVDEDPKVWKGLIEDTLRMRREERLQKRRRKMSGIQTSRRKLEATQQAEGADTFVMNADDDCGDVVVIPEGALSGGDDNGGGDGDGDANTGSFGGGTTVVHDVGDSDTPAYGGTSVFHGDGSPTSSDSGDGGTSIFRGDIDSGTAASWSQDSGDSGTSRPQLRRANSEIPDFMKRTLRTMNLGKKGAEKKRPMSAVSESTGATRRPRAAPISRRVRNFQASKKPTLRNIKRDARLVWTHWRELSPEQYGLIALVALGTVSVVAFLLFGISWMLADPVEVSTQLDLYHELQVPRTVLQADLDGAYRRVRGILENRMRSGPCDTCQAELAQADLASSILRDTYRRDVYDRAHPLAGRSRAAWSESDGDLLDTTIRNLKSWWE
jgi:serine/threonine protein kinase